MGLDSEAIDMDIYSNCTTLYYYIWIVVGGDDLSSDLHSAGYKWRQISGSSTYGLGVVGLWITCIYTNIYTHTQTDGYCMIL